MSLTSRQEIIKKSAITSFDSFKGNDISFLSYLLNIILFHWNSGISSRLNSSDNIQVNTITYFKIFTHFIFTLILSV
jgi:hypothetical protein